jgi:hypothetical protein
MMYNWLQDFLYTLENKDSSKPSDWMMHELVIWVQKYT